MTTDEIVSWMLVLDALAAAKTAPPTPLIAARLSELALSIRLDTPAGVCDAAIAVVDACDVAAPLILN